MTDELDSARDHVLVDNTAQAVFKHLDRVEDARTTLGLRWIWELLQNARDAALAEGVQIRVRLSESDLTFEHNGRPFASAEIAHLVYHGSTKIESFDDLGQFGSGFLSTHLLSRTVRVAGCLDDSRRFAFSLDRTGDTVEQLRHAMDRSWRAFKQSAQDGDLMSHSSHSRSTSFVYELAEQGHELAQGGLSDLHRCGPAVLAFCPEINSIVVESADSKWHLKRDRRAPLHDGHLLSIHYQNDGQALSRFVAVADSRLELCAALQLHRTDSGFQIDHVTEPVPKLFVMFPLIGSERLGLPVIINSRRFKPREDRDGIVLQGDSSGAQVNRQLLEDSVQHQGRLLDCCAREKWKGAERLLEFDTAHLPDWVDADYAWFCGLLADLVRKARTTPLLLTLSGDWIEPHAAWLPTIDHASHRDRLWDLMSSWRDAPARLPCRDHLPSWSRNLSNWAALLDVTLPDMDEAFTTVAVAQLVSDAGNLDDLQQQLTDRDSLHWLIGMLRLLQDAGDTRLFDTHNLLPSQGGRLRRRADLRRDKGISDELKDIAEAFDLDIRNELLNTHVNIDAIAGLLVPESEPELLDKLLARVNEECADGAIHSSHAPWAVKLFWWMAAREDYLDRVDGYPVPTTDEDGDRITVVRLDAAAGPSNRPMTPVTTWPEGAQRFASLFPKRRVLAAAFGGEGPDPWRPLAGHGYVTMSPLIEAKRAVSAFLPDDPLPDAEGVDAHKSTHEVPVSDVAFLDELIDTARKSKKRAIEFIHFIIDFVTATDDRAFEETAVACECEEEHRIYRAAWLVPLCRRRWVPVDTSGRRAAQASAESLAALLADSPDIVERLSGEGGEKLTKALGISRADLALRVVAEDESTRVTLIHSMQDLTEAAEGDVDRVREFVTEIREHPEIIESIEEQKSRRRKIQRNHDVGRLVEDLLRQELESRGLTVRRSGRGSDFEIESDYVDNDEEIWLELVNGSASTFVEVKSTRVNQAKMTPLQAETACGLDSRFALCVVPLADDNPTRETVRSQCRFVFGIGTHLSSPW